MLYLFQDRRHAFLEARHGSLGNCNDCRRGTRREWGRHSQSAGGTVSSPSPTPIVLVDSTGKVAARPLNETMVLVTVSSEIAAPALIRPIYDTDGRTASGLATWQAGGACYSPPLIARRVLMCTARLLQACVRRRRYRRRPGSYSMWEPWALRPRWRFNRFSTKPDVQR